MHNTFWEKQPALLFGLSLLIGSGSFLFGSTAWWVWPVVWASYLAWMRRWPAIVFLIGAIFYGWAMRPAEASGSWGHFSIHSLQTHSSPFHQGLLYKGWLTLDGKRVPCHIHYTGDAHPAAHCDYVLKGRPQKRDNYLYSFKSAEWHPVPKSWSLAELRYNMKERLRRFLDTKLTHPRTASFLSSLITGDVEDRSLRFEFGRLGLQHILAISGFHFAILIAFCSFFLGLFFPHRTKIVILLLAVNAYFLFVGALPAVQRSWLTVFLYLLGQLIYRHASGLNLLGVALLAEVMLDPLICAHLGFQLSFLSCAGILLFTPLIEPLLLPWIPDHYTAPLTLLEKHVHLIAIFIRKALSVNLAVNIAILPLLLFHFHQFPLLSLLYNLFFPFLLSGALFLLLLSLLAHVAFGLDWPFHLTDFFTAQLLDLSAYPPTALDFSLRVPSLPGWTIPLYLFTLLFSTIMINFRTRVRTRNSFPAKSRET